MVARPGAEQVAVPTRQLRRGRWWWFAGPFLLIELALLVRHSAFVYQRFSLTLDFGTFYQAWTQIGSGRLSPQSTLYDFPYWRHHFELVMWPLALLHQLSPSGLTLLIIQDIAIVASQLVAGLWMRDVLRVDGHMAIHGRWFAWCATACGFALMIVNADVFETATYDFHVQPLATVALLVAAREFWRGRYRRAWLAAGMTLLVSDVATTYVVGLGLSLLLAGRRTRTHGVALILLGGAWMALASGLGATEGSDLQAGYAYLIGDLPSPTGLMFAAVIVGAATHPHLVIRQILSRSSVLFVRLAPSGLIGVAAPWTIGVTASVVLPAVIHGQPAFVEAAFQMFPGQLFATVGTVMILSRVAALPGRWARGGAAGVLVAFLLVALSIVPGRLEQTRNRWLRIDAGTAAELEEVLAQVPDDAEVLASHGVVGRFAERPAVFSHPIIRADDALPIRADKVWFVFVPYQGVQLAAPDQTEAAIQFVAVTLGARLVTDENGVYAYEWKPPPRVKALKVP